MDDTALRTTGFTRSRVTFKDPSPRSDITISPRRHHDQQQPQYNEDTMRSTWGSDFATTVGSEVFILT